MTPRRSPRRRRPAVPAPVRVDLSGLKWQDRPEYAGAAFAFDAKFEYRRYPAEPENLLEAAVYRRPKGYRGRTIADGWVEVLPA